MRRIYAIWFLKQAAPVLMAMPLSLALTLWLTAREFFVAKIIENFIISLHSGSIFAFVGSALYNAPLLPVAIIGFSGGLFLILAYKAARNFSQLTLVRI